MIGIIIYQLLWLIALLVLALLPKIVILPEWFTSNLLFVNCSLMGGMGGVLYCLRGIYLNKSVHKRWDKDWYVWYYLRPVTSLLSGLVSYIFLKAGLLVLDAAEGDAHFGYLAVAFVAGYNVDKFLQKLESIAKTLWGIDKSRSSGDE